MNGALRLAWKSLARNRARTLFTTSGIAVSVFLFTALSTVVAALDDAFSSAGRDPLMVITHRGGFFHTLPEAEKAHIDATAGIVDSTGVEFYSATFGEVSGPQDVFPIIGIEDHDVATFWGSEIELSHGAVEAFRAEKNAALVGPMLVQRFGWKVGDRVSLKGAAHPVDLSFTIVGTAAFRTERGSFIFHRELLEDALSNPANFNLFYARAKSPSAVAGVCRAIEDRSRATPYPLRCMPLRQQLETLVAMIGDVRSIASNMAVMVLIAVMFVVANAMVLATRERTREFAVLRALGFSRGFVAGLVIIEAAFLGAAGGAIGVTLAILAFGRGFSVAMGPLSGFALQPGTMATAVLVAIGVAVTASIVPATFSARVQILRALRRG